MYPYKDFRRLPHYDYSRKWNLIEKSEIHHGSLVVKESNPHEQFPDRQNSSSNFKDHEVYSKVFRPVSPEKTSISSDLKYYSHLPMSLNTENRTICPEPSVEIQERNDKTDILTRPCFTRRQQEVTMYSSEPPYMNTYTIYQIVDSDSVITEQPTSIIDSNSECPTHSTSSSMASPVTSFTSSDDFKDPDIVTIGEIREHMCYYVMCCGICCD